MDAIRSDVAHRHNVGGGVAVDMIVRGPRAECWRMQKRRIRNKTCWSTYVTDQSVLFSLHYDVDARVR